MAVLNIQPQIASEGLHERVDRMANHSSYQERMWRTEKSIREEEGPLASVILSVGLAVSCIYSATFAYFCLEGSLRSLDEAYSVYDETGEFGQSIGDAGGWMSLAVFAFFTYNALFEQCMREGDYLSVKKTCQQWYQEGQNISIEKFYTKVTDILDAVSSQCFRYKSRVSQVLQAVETVEELQHRAPLHPTSTLSLDLGLKPSYQHAMEQMEKVSSLANYFQRMANGVQATRERFGSSNALGNAISGTAIPIILFVGCLFSAIGEVQLGKKLFGEKKELVEVGHFGEWPDNIVEAGCFGYFLHKDLLLRGDIRSYECIFRRQLDLLHPEKNPNGGNTRLYNRFCEIANEEMKQISATCFFAQPLRLDFFEQI